MNLEKIKNLLINISQFEIIKIIDNSSSHASHKGVQGLLNNLTHVEIHVKNPNNLNIKTTVNDITLQNSNTNDLIFNVQELISFLSQGTTLAKGSIILTGTPEGVGFARDPPLWLKQGDSVEVAVEDIGILCNRIEEE